MYRSSPDNNLLGTLELDSTSWVRSSSYRLGAVPTENTFPNYSTIVIEVCYRAVA
jgi:hypothetical protein